MVDQREFIRESNAIEDVCEETAVDDSVDALEYLEIRRYSPIRTLNRPTN